MVRAQQWLANGHDLETRGVRSAFRPPEWRWLCRKRCGRWRPRRSRSSSIAGRSSWMRNRYGSSRRWSCGHGISGVATTASAAARQRLGTQALAPGHHGIAHGLGQASGAGDGRAETHRGLGRCVPCCVPDMRAGSHGQPGVLALARREGFLDGVPAPPLFMQIVTRRCILLELRGTEP